MHEIKKIIYEIEQRGYKVKNFSSLTIGINSSTFKIEGFKEKYLLKIYNSSKINSINSPTGILSIIDKQNNLPFDIKRIFYVH